MSDNKNDFITSGQLFALLCGVMIGTGILNLARAVSEVSRQDAWISVIAAGLGVMVNIVIIITLTKRFPSSTIVEYSQLILGKWLGRILVVVHIIFHTFVASLVLRIMDALIASWFLPRTPMMVLMVCSMLVIVYMTMNGVKVLARYSFFMFFFLLPFVLLIFPPVIKSPFFINLMPVGGTGIKTILMGMLPAMYSFSGYETLQIFYPFVINKDKALRASLGAALFTTAAYASTVAAQLIIYSYEELRFILYPLMRFISYIRIPIIERMEFLFIYFWIFAISNTIGVEFFAASISIQRLFNIKKLRNIALILAPVVIFIASYPKNVAQVITIIGYTSKLGLAIAFGIPSMLLIIARLRGIKEEQHEKSKG